MIKKLSFLLLLIIAAVGCSDSKRYYKFDGFAQGGTWQLTFSSTKRYKEIKKIQSGIDSILLEIDNSINGYNKNSLLSRFNAGEDIIPDKNFKMILLISNELCQQTENKFNPSAAPLFDLWSFGFTGDKLETIPSKSTIDSVMQFVGMNHYSMNSEGNFTKDNPGCKLNFNAIAQGYTCDVIAKYLKSQGSEDFIIELGGEVLCCGKKADGELWNVVCDAPDAASDTLQVTDCAIVTSGNYRKNFKDSIGHCFGHIIDPRTGYPTENISSSRTIIVKCDESPWPCAMADALATAAMIDD